jgi:DNA-binding NtrC family response regulator
MPSRPEAPTEYRPRIIVADGDREAGALLADYFSRRGFLAEHTTLGSEVLTHAATGPLAMVVVDVALGDMSGHALVARLKGMDPGVHVLMTTADYRPEFEVRARQMGILHYAQKPIDYARIEAIVAKAIGLSRPA